MKQILEPEKLSHFRSFVRANGICGPHAQLGWPHGIWQAHIKLCRLTGLSQINRMGKIKHKPFVFDEWWNFTHSMIVQNPETAQHLRQLHRQPERGLTKFPSGRYCNPMSITHQERAEFFASDEWKSLRYNMLKKYGGRCMLCGANSSKTVIQVDHIKPIWTHPELKLDPSNLQVLCRECNLGKGARDQTDWRKRNQTADRLSNQPNKFLTNVQPLPEPPG